MSASAKIRWLNKYGIPELRGAIEREDWNDAEEYSETILDTVKELSQEKGNDLAHHFFPAAKREEG